MTKPIPPEKRKIGFWFNVKKNGLVAPNMNTPCWLWLGATTSGGYGLASMKGHSRLAHRVAWEMANGPIPQGKHILHKCDIPNCVRNDRDSHLFMGTPRENMADMYAKGRGPMGDRNGSRTKPERRAYGDRNGTRTHPESRPRGQEHWTHRMPDKVLRGEENGNAKLTDMQVLRIKRLYATGNFSQVLLAEKYNVSQVHISRLVRGKMR